MPVEPNAKIISKEIALDIIWLCFIDFPEGACFEKGIPSCSPKLGASGARLRTQPEDHLSYG